MDVYYYDHGDDDDKEEENAVTYFSSNCVDVFPDAAISTNLLIDSLSDGTFLTYHREMPSRVAGVGEAR